MARAARPGRWLWMLVAAAILSQGSLNLARLLISYKALALGGDAVAIGFISAAFAILPAVVAISLGRLSDRTAWLRPLIATGLLTLTVSCLLLSGSASLLLVAVGSAGLGLGHLAFAIAAQSMIAKRSDPDSMDAGFGWFTAGFALGQMVGPLLAGVLLSNPGATTVAGRIEDIDQALLLAGLLALIAVPLILVRIGSRGTAGTALKGVATLDVKDSVGMILGRPGVKSNMLASLALLTTMDILIAFLPLIAEQQGVPPLVVGLLLALRAAATILSRMLLTVLLRRWSRNQLVLASLFGAALGLVVLPYVLENIWIAAASQILVGFFLGLGQPLTMALISRAVREESRGAALAIRLLGNRIGQIVLPAAAGLAAAPLGPSGAIWMTCFVLGAAGAVKGIGDRRLPPPV
ncbi:MFS family permease [Arthrobacter sp. CAN_A6]|uniref:MFS transporter n=1 Tax=Arthrobacter sp. CAN_A6 TaxID=2787721 RepID=UPI0018CA91B7